MAEGRSEYDDAMMASLKAVIANCHISKKPAFTSEDFIAKPRNKNTEVKKAPLSILRDVFCKPNIKKNKIIKVKNFGGQTKGDSKDE